MVCEKCHESVGSARYCPSCGTPTQLGRQAITEETRFQSLGDAIASSYVSEPRKPLRNPFRKGSPAWFALGLVLIVVAVVAAGFAVSRLPRSVRADVQTPTQAQSARQLAAQRLADQRFAQQQIAADSLRAASPVPAQASTPSPTQAPTSAPSATPSPAPTASPTTAPTSAPSATPTEAAVSTAPSTIHNAPLIVRSIGTMKVGKRGSCGGQDATIDVPGYPRGCTVFDAVSSGPLKNGHGTVLVVPVSTSEDVSETAYGLLYVQTDADTPPHYLSILPGVGSGRLTLRVQNGVIVVQSDAQTEYFTYDGHHIKPI